MLCVCCRSKWNSGWKDFNLVWFSNYSICLLTLLIHDPWKISVRRQKHPFHLDFILTYKNAAIAWQFKSLKFMIQIPISSWTNVLLFSYLTCLSLNLIFFDCNWRSALDYCQEAVAILEQFVDKVASTGEDNTFYSSAVQDRVAAAYLWQALLEHKVTIEEKQTGQSPGLCENFEIDEVCGSFVVMLSRSEMVKLLICLSINTPSLPPTFSGNNTSRRLDSIRSKVFRKM